MSQTPLAFYGHALLHIRCTSAGSKSIFADPWKRVSFGEYPGRQVEREISDVEFTLEMHNSRLTSTTTRTVRASLQKFNTYVVYRQSAQVEPSLASPGSLPRVVLKMCRASYCEVSDAQKFHAVRCDGCWELPRPCSRALG